MMRNILLGALAGAAVAYLLVKKRNNKKIEQTYHQLGNYLHQVKEKVMDKLEKGKGQVGSLGEHANKMVHSYVKN